MLVLDRARGLIHRFNQTASLIWKQCDGRGTVPGIAAHVATAFDVDIDTAQRDTRAAISRFDEVGLLDGINEPAGSLAMSDHENQRCT